METNYWNELFVVSGQFIIPFLFLPVIVGLLRWKHLDKPLRIFFYSLLVYVLLNVFDILYYIAAETYMDFFRPWLEFTDYMVVFTLILYQLNTFLLLGCFYTYLFPKPSSKVTLKVLSYGLALLAIIAFFFECGWRNYGTIGPITEAMFRFLVPLVYLWWLSQRHLGVKLTSMSYFWIALGLILPSLVGFLLFLIGNSLSTEQPTLFYQLSLLKNIFVISSAVFYSIAFWKAKPIAINN